MLTLKPFTVNTTIYCLSQRYGEQDFAKAEGHKTEKRKRGEPRQRGGGRVKKFVTAPERRNWEKVTENPCQFVK